MILLDSLAAASRFAPDSASASASPSRLLRGISLALGSWLALSAPVVLAAPDGAQDGFRQVERPGAVDLEAEYALEDLAIPRDEIHALLARDAIPALVDPKLESGAEAEGWLRDTDRVVEVTVGDESVAVPFRVLNWHEIANLVVGGEPVAATY